MCPHLVHAKLNIVTTTSDLASLAKEVAGDLADVTSIARGDQDPHFLEAKPSFVALLNRADVLIDVGLELEVGWLPVLTDQARNSKIMSGQPGRITATEGIRILEIPTGPVDRSMGDVHPHGNPHYCLDPRNGLIIAHSIMERLQSIDPPHAAVYRKNFDDFSSRFKSKMVAWQGGAQKLKGVLVVAHHRSFSYLFNWLGMELFDVIEPKPGIPPPPAHIVDLIQKIPTAHVKMILAENYYDPKPANELSKKTGVPVLHLPASVGGDKGINSYFDLFDSMLQQMTGAL